MGVISILLGGVAFITFIVLQFVKVSFDGASISASQANGVCQSALGQFGQALSSGFGDSAPAGFCNQAATIEDWKGITIWLAIVLVFFGVGVIGKSIGLIPGQPVKLRTPASPGGNSRM